MNWRKNSTPLRASFPLKGFGLLLIAAILLLAETAAFAQPEKAPNPDETCLACHSQSGFKSDSGKDIFVDPAKHAAGAHSVLGCQDCHTAIKEFPHPAKIPQVQCAICHADETKNLPASVHGVLGSDACVSCHGSAHDLKTAEKLAPGKCAECHADEVKKLHASIHGQAAQAGDKDAPTCFSCHGPVHNIRSHDDPASMVAKQNLPTTCASCHSRSDFLSRHNIPIAHPVELYQQSVHGRALAAGNFKVASCSSCHGSHDIFPARDARSKVNHWNVAGTCGACHTDIQKTYLSSIHGQGMLAGAGGAPVCTDCHGEHLILGPKDPNSPVNAARVSIVTCERCHGDARLAQSYNLPADRVPSYAQSFHGLANREGSQTVANCASCHGVHNIFRSNDPRSTVNPANLAATCGNCHSGAGKSFAIGAVHVQISQGPAHPVVEWIRRAYLVLIPATLGFMILHNLIDFLAKLMRGRSHHAGSSRQALRMGLHFRIAHWLVMVSFPTLVVTGFMLKFPDQWWAQALAAWKPLYAARGTVHRAAAIVLVLSLLYHFVDLAVNRRDRLILKYMLVRFSDATEMLNAILYNLGVSKERPVYGKFNYVEKMEYWAFLWGTFVMAVSGFLLWFNSFALRHFPKWTTDAATAIHYYEALLATFSILIWHMYGVIFDPDVYPMDLSWLNGKVPADHYLEKRPEYLETLEQEGLVSDGDENGHSRNT